jgi:hypothetical protein
MNSSEFVEKALDIAKNYKTSYIWGGFGSPITEASLKRAAAEYSKNTEKGWIAAAKKYQGDPKAFYFDCVGLIKAIIWGWCGDASKSYGGAVYPTAAAVKAGACPDKSADGMIAVCSGVSTYFSGIVPGAAVWMTGHIGIYVGDGLCVECTPSWANGVQITAVSNIGTKAGYKSRKWTKWGKIPYINYEEEIDMSKDELKKLIRETVKEVLDEENPVYKDLKDVPASWQKTTQALLDAGAVNGGTPAEVCATDLNLRKETLKAAVVAVLYHEAKSKE